MASSLIIGTLTVVAPLAFAQAPEIEEIIVTAEKRGQRLQTVANSITVFTSEDLESLGIGEPRDLAEQTPGLLTKFGPNGLATVGFYMRGVGINDFTGTSDPSVGVYVNEVFKPTPDMLNFAVFDIERIEIVKGPQGTLYGQNSTGGAVNIITKKPTPEFEGFARAEYSRFVTGTVTGAISGPISKKLLGRLSFQGKLSSSDSGYSFNRTTNNTLGKNNQGALRAQLEWLPHENLDVSVMYNYGQQDSEQPLLQHVGAADANNPGQICAPILAGFRSEGPCVDLVGFFDPDNNPFDGESNVDPRLHIEDHNVTGTINWDLPRFTITAITGYEKFKKRQSQDIDASPFVIADNRTRNAVNSVSQEVRVTSNDTWPVAWIFGGNYSRSEVNWFQTIDLSAILFPTSNGANQITKSWAVFGHVTVPLSEVFELVGGLRFTHEQRTWVGASFIGNFSSLDEGFASGAPILSALPLPVGDPRRGGPFDFDNSVEEKKVDFQAVLKYRPNDNMMFYASASEAFRSGGFSSAIIFSQDALKPFDAENLRAYEEGFKLKLANGRVQFNGSLFQYNFKGFQATFVRAAEASARLQNAGNVNIVGSEASLIWLPTASLTMNLGFSWLHNRIRSSDVTLPPLDGGPATTIKGNKIPNAPKYSLNGRIRYETQLRPGFLGRIQTSFTYVSQHFLEPNNRKALVEDGYFLLNGRLSILPEDGSWQASVWVRNLTDVFYRSAAQDLFLSLRFAEIVVSPPRTWGIEIGYRF